MTLTSTKIKITGTIEVLTGLHIGGDNSFSAIGAIDSTVVRDQKSRGPIIPGSSIKGKLRTLLARDKNVMPKRKEQGFNECPEIIRLFGSHVGNSDAAGTGIQKSRLMFKDAFLCNNEEIEAARVSVFETKFENTIDRLTAVANPRQIERVIRGAKFDLEIIYNVEDPEQIEEDFANLQIAIDLLRNDYLGGGGTRGNGRVEFSGIETEVVTGDKETKIPELK